MYPLHVPNTREIEGIDLTEKEYWVWILWLTIENHNDSGTCLFFRTQGKEEKDFLTGGSIQTTIPFDDYYYLDDYQDFLIRMTGGMYILAHLEYFKVKYFAHVAFQYV